MNQLKIDDVNIYNQAVHRQEAYLTTTKIRKEFLCCIAKNKSWRQDPMVGNIHMTGV